MFRKWIANCSINLKSPISIPYARSAKELFEGDREDLLLYQKTAYEQLLRYAYEHTVYYNRVFEQIGLFADGVLNEEKIAKIPILTKQIIREEGSNLYSDEMEARGAYSNTSGGSTGEPVLFIQDKEYFAKNFGDKILFGLLNGKEPGEKEIKLWGSERDILQGTIGLKEKIINFCFNREFLNSFVLDEEKLETYVDVINKKKPKQIWTYADSIYQVARYINRAGKEVYSPHNIITTAGVLYDEMRDEIQKAFPNSRILNQYGSREAGAIGIEVNGQKGIRVFEHSVLLEVKDELTHEIQRIGKGELLVTNLTNYSMPLIRYQIGDMGELEEIDESYTGSFSIIKKLIGRTNSYLKKADGTMVHGEYVTHLFYHKEWIENFQVVQHDYEQIEFRIVLRAGKSVVKNDLESMMNDLKKVYGACNIEVNLVDEIPKLKSGKYQFVITEISN